MKPCLRLRRFHLELETATEQQARAPEVVLISSGLNSDILLYSCFQTFSTCQLQNKLVEDINFVINCTMQKN